MSDPRAPEREPRPGAEHAQEVFDREIDLRGIAWTAIGLLVTAVVVHLLMWWLFVGFRRLEKAEDPPPSPILEARQRRLPPEPRLQADPQLDMNQLRDAEDRLLYRPEWVDRQRGTLRIPIDLAMDVIARRGVPAVGAGGPATPEEARRAGAGRPSVQGASPGAPGAMPGPPGAVPGNPGSGPAAPAPPGRGPG